MESQSFRPTQMKMNSINHTGLYREFKPTENLRKYIYCYWTTHFPTDILRGQIIIPKDEIVIPDGCIDLILGTDRDGKSCRNLLVGTMSRGSMVNMEHNNIETFGIRFYPGGLQAFMTNLISSVIFMNLQV